MSDPRQTPEAPHEILGVKLPRRVCPASIAAGFALLVGILTGLFAYTHIGAIQGSSGSQGASVASPAIVQPATPDPQAPEPPRTQKP